MLGSIFTFSNVIALSGLVYFAYPVVERYVKKTVSAVKRVTTLVLADTGFLPPSYGEEMQLKEAYTNLKNLRDEIHKLRVDIAPDTSYVIANKGKLKYVTNNDLDTRRTNVLTLQRNNDFSINELVKKHLPLHIKLMEAVSAVVKNDVRKFKSCEVLLTNILPENVSVLRMDWRSPPISDPEPRNPNPRDIMYVYLMVNNENDRVFGVDIRYALSPNPETEKSPPGREVKQAMYL
jgi:hypothetical protein